jgi:hypothetical protein
MNLRGASMSCDGTLTRTSLIACQISNTLHRGLFTTTVSKSVQPFRNAKRATKSDDALDVSRSNRKNLCNADGIDDAKSSVFVWSEPCPSTWLAASRSAQGSPGLATSCAVDQTRDVTGVSKSLHPLTQLVDLDRDIGVIQT